MQSAEPIKTMKKLYHVACAFPGGAWQLSSEEVEMFMEAGKHAHAASLPGLGPGIRLLFLFTPEERVLLERFVFAFRSAPPFPEDDEFTARTQIKMQLDFKPFEQAVESSTASNAFETIDGTAFLEIWWEGQQLQIGVSVWLGIDMDEEDPALDLHGFKDVDRLIRTLQRQRFRCFAVNHGCKKQGMLIQSGDGGHIGAWFSYKAAADQHVELPLDLSIFLESLVAGRPVQCLLIPHGKKRQRACLSQGRHRQHTRQT